MASAVKSTPTQHFLMRPGDVAEVLGVHRMTVHRWGSSGRLRFVTRPNGHRAYLSDDVYLQGALLGRFNDQPRRRDNAPGG